MSDIARTLGIPLGKSEDADGTSIGDNWLLADMGVDPDGVHWYVTTDHVRASEFVGMNLLAEPEMLAEFLRDQINREWHEYLASRDNE